MANKSLCLSEVSSVGLWIENFVRVRGKVHRLHSLDSNFPCGWDNMIS
jgi:hypothetical protein